MGRSYVFECPKCTYKTVVSGGADAGVDCSVQTIHCGDCRKLYDAVIRLRVIQDGTSLGAGVTPLRKRERPPVFDDVRQQLPKPAGGRFHWKIFPLRCPVSARHSVEVWSDPGKCPVCKSFLEKGGIPFRLWT
ncbi:MAG TPA: hypothetical protein VEH04_11105 [Verrucomicrobiae bacterium]|nr:hypothetical protein [Verrucomicrobiae bacterium]